MYSLRRVAFNALTFVPGVASLPPVKRYMERRVIGTGGSNSARYCYSVWLRHLVKAAAIGRPVQPRTIAELGPGDSLGTGLAALLSGAERYFAFDVVAHTDVRNNEAVFEELVELFARRADIPDESEFPGVTPRLSDYRFPAHLLDAGLLASANTPQRIARIRAALRDTSAPDSPVQYRAPWQDDQLIEEGSVDMIFSQAVLEHVDALADTYACMHRWLAPSGYMSHQIDLKSHGWAQEWNGHWTYSDFMWKLVRGKDSWLINREPAATHLALLQQHGFRVLATERVRKDSAIGAGDLADRFRGMSDEDLHTSGLFVQAVRA